MSVSELVSGARRGRFLIVHHLSQRLLVGLLIAGEQAYVLPPATRRMRQDLGSSGRAAFGIGVTHSCRALSNRARHRIGWPIEVATDARRQRRPVQDGSPYASQAEVKAGQPQNR